jgi:NAD(P)-dependent dehydrogenase (short-subunit alcohol dehydrogenase family)
MTPEMDMLTKQGYDLQFGVNVLGHYYLTKLLIPILERTAATLPSTDPVRIIETSSDGHLVSPTNSGYIINYETLLPGKARTSAGKFPLYAQSKSGNILVSNARARYLENKNIASMSVHPGELSIPHSSSLIPLFFLDTVGSL